jgi:hypothetical protein
LYSAERIDIAEYNRIANARGSVVRKQFYNEFGPDSIHVPQSNPYAG